MGGCTQIDTRHTHTQTNTSKHVTILFFLFTYIKIHTHTQEMDEISLLGAASEASAAWEAKVEELKRALAECDGETKVCVCVCVCECMWVDWWVGGCASVYLCMSVLFLLLLLLLF